MRNDRNNRSFKIAPAPKLELPQQLSPAPTPQPAPLGGVAGPAKPEPYLGQVSAVPDGGAERPVSHNATEPPPVDPSLRSNEGAGQSFDEFAEAYRSAVIRGDFEIYKFLEGAVKWAFRCESDPSVRVSVSGEPLPDADAVTLLGLLLKRMEPPDRKGQQRANKEYLALQVLIQDGVAHDQIAEQLQRRRGVAELAAEHARRRRHNGPPADEAPLKRCSFEIPRELADGDQLVLLVRMESHSGARVKGATEVIGAVPAQMNIADIKQAVAKLLKSETVTSA